MIEMQTKYQVPFDTQANVNCQSHFQQLHNIR